MSDAWIDIKEAAALMGYSADYFRRLYCDSEHPLVTIRETTGARGGRRIRVYRLEIELLIESQTKRPA